MKNKTFEITFEIETSPIVELPAQINFLIFSFLLKEEQLDARLVSRTWNSFIFNEQIKRIGYPALLINALYNENIRKTLLSNPEISSKS